MKAQLIPIISNSKYFRCKCNTDGFSGLGMEKKKHNYLVKIQLPTLPLSNRVGSMDHTCINDVSLLY